jgi:hypothetical protein
MVAMARVRVAWQGWPGSPGVSTFYLADPPTQSQIDGIRAYFNAFVGSLPSGLTITVPQSGDVIDDVSGLITSSWSVGTAPTVVTGTGAGNYAGNAGAVQHWLTGSVINRRRVRGRTFLVPLVSTSYDTAGSLSTTMISTLNAAGTALLTALGTNFRVWHRPKNGISGGSAVVTGHRVPDLAVSLRSRRI